MDGRTGRSSGAATSVHRLPRVSAIPQNAAPSSSPSSHAPRSNGTARQPGVKYDNYQQHSITADVLAWEEDNNRHRSMQTNALSERDSRYPDFPLPLSRTQPQAIPQQSKHSNDPSTQTSRLSKHRNSLPTPLPGNSTPTGGVNPASDTFAPQPTSLSAAHLPTASSFPLPVALQRLKEADLETFKLARACGMTPDPVRISRPPKSFLVDEQEPAERRGLADRDSYDNHGVNRRVTLPRAYERTKGKEKDKSPTQTYYQQCNRTTNGSPIPPSQSTQSLSTLGSKCGLPDLSRSPPPFVPVHNPAAQLARLAALLRRHRSAWNAVGSPSPSVNSSLSGTLAPAALIDVDSLLHEHVTDAQVEVMRTEVEREDGQKDGNEGWRKPMVLVDVSEPGYRVFGQPLSLTRMYASCVSSMAGFQHDLPIVVYACVEELYRTGMTVPGLFRTAPDRIRHSELIDLFDRGPSFGRNLTLAKESTADICALLRSYIDRLPRAIWHESLFNAMWTLCVLPSRQREKRLVEESEREEYPTAGPSTPRRKNARPSSLIIPKQTAFNTDPDAHKDRARSVSLNSSFTSSQLAPAVTLPDGWLSQERHQLAASRALFRLLPRAQLALLAYLCAFFTQLPLSPQNQLSIEDVARLFAAPLFLGKPHTGAGGVGPVPATGAAWSERKEEARAMMIWILRRWTYISDRLFDAGVADDLDEDRPVEVAGGMRDEAASASSSDTESVYSQLSAYAWPAAVTHPCDVLIDPLSPVGPTDAINPGFEDSPPSVSLPAQELRPAILRKRACIEQKATKPSVEPAVDLSAWKSLVEKDINELRRALVDVRARLDKQPSPAI
ncbi:hypothetical protein M0805_003212 [Coniferiporia weirii]|nr:hypothetical protein M0805_003212 [Coniferiporia weirii]